MKPGITVVSGTYNRLPLLERMVASARASLPPGIQLEFIVVDGGSMDGTQQFCQAQRDITLIEHGELRGAIPAFCDGAKAAGGKYVVLANDDIEFVGNSILRALIYLETHPTCGAVAFADNRPSPGKSGYAVMPMGAMRNGKAVSVNYAQVGMFRRWLGDDIGWWGADDATFPARTYAGDNYLSSGIWQRGYTVDAAPGVQVDDMVADDDLRRLNGSHRQDGSHPDSEAYFARFPQGASIPNAPTLPNPDSERLRVLYLPVYEPGYPVQKQQKTGLRDALSERAWVYEVDFLDIPAPRLYNALAETIQTFQPHMILSQIQAPAPITPVMVRQLRALAPSTVWVNWNGDVWAGGLTSPDMLGMCAWFDLQLTVNADVLPVYAQHGIAAGYWQIAYEEPGDVEHSLNAGFDVVFLANAYEPQRKTLGRDLFLEFRRSFRVGLFGSGWDELSNGFTLYDFAAGKAIYQNAKIALGDNQFPQARGFVSNRMFQAMAAGYCLYMQQVVPGLEELTGLQHGVHYIAWKDTDDLRDKLTFYLAHDDERKRIADAGTAFVRERHSFQARVTELFKSLLPLAKRRPREFVTFTYKGGRTKPFGVAGYGMYTPGQLLRLPEQAARDAGLFQTPELWHKVESEMT